MVVAKRVTYRGRVQGVGFRFTALELSRDYAVHGTVRNCADGRVDLFVQGEKDQVHRFLTDLGQKMQDYIEDQTIQDAEPTAVQGFHIVR